MRCRVWSFLTVAMAMGAFACAQEREGKPGEDYATFNVSELEAVIGNNNGKDFHRAWYNGIFGLYSPHQAKSPYVPFYAGINLENFFDARSRHPDRSVFFEPRSAPMSFRKVSDRVAELHQETTLTYGIESFMRFELKEPYYVDYVYSAQGGVGGKFLWGVLGVVHCRAGRQECSFSSRRVDVGRSELGAVPLAGTRSG